MASSLATASAVTKATNLPHSNDANFKNCPISNLSFPLSRKPSLRFVASKGLLQSRGTSTAIRAQLNEVAVDGSSNSAASPSTKSDAPAQQPKSASETLATEESISEVISQVASLVKLVDSRDIVELQLKQLDCELIIRKKEALPQPAPPPPVPVAANYAFSPPMSPPSPTLPPAPVQAYSPAPVPAPAPSPPAARSSSSSLPPLKSPMAGTFYRSPGPGEPPFVKVGDKVQKGQVLCIIEAMKLMNEIEADQSGTIVEIVAEDGKPVSVDTPLFVIKP